MYDRAIAEQMRLRGHDVVAVTERQDLRGVSDEELLRRMAEEKRVLVTEKAVHLVPAFRRLLHEGGRCAGLLISSPRSIPRSHSTIGLYVETLERELNKRPDDTLDDQMLFLSA